MHDFLLENSSIDLVDFIESKSNINETLENIVSEQEIMCSIYESYRFIVEQDTAIFMSLNYGIIEERAAFSRLGEIIKSIFRKIKELIKKFFDFITGKRKKENDYNNERKKADENIKVIEKNIEDLEEAIEKTKKETDEMIDNALKNIKEKRERFENMKQQKEETITKTKERLHVINDNKRYIPIELYDGALKYDYNRRFEDIEEIRDMFDAIKECTSIIKDQNKCKLFEKVKNNDDLSKLFKKHGYTNMAKIEDYIHGKGNASSPNYFPKDLHTKVANTANRTFIYVDEENRVDLDTYKTKFYEDNCKFFDKYSDHSKDVMFDTTNTYNSLTAAEKSIPSDVDGVPPCLINRLYQITSWLQEAYMSRSSMLLEIERGYTAHLHNLKLLNSDAKRVENLKQENKNTYNQFANFLDDLDVEGIKKNNPGLVEDILKILNS